MKDFVILKNVLSPDAIEIAKRSIIFTKNQHYYDNQIPKEDKNFCTGQFIKHDCWELYAPPISEAILIEVQGIIEQAVEKELVPTYSFVRIYWPGADMEKHVDRPACEYSASLCISVDPTPWAIWMNGKELFLNPGDMIVYKGMEVEHWREVYTGNEQVQVFLHYVDAAGPHADACKFDSRDEIGVFAWK
jgi:hypothetical protein